MTTSEIGESLRRFRKNYNISQKKAAEDMGVSRTMYQAYERGDSAPSIVFLINLADVYNVSLDYLTGRNFESQNFSVKSDAPSINNSLTIEERITKLETAFAKQGIKI